nr:Gag-Pol polyprotein [Tanacetum cinerariifolium]
MPILSSYSSNQYLVGGYVEDGGCASLDTGLQHIHLGIFMIRLDALHRRSAGTNALVVLRDTRWEDCTSAGTRFARLSLDNSSCLFGSTADSRQRPSTNVSTWYVQWKFRIKRYIDTKPNHELIHDCLTNPPYELGWKDKEVPTSEGSLITTTERVHETYKNVLQEIRDQLNAKAEAVQIILTGIDNDIYSTVDACPNACEMWKSIERLKLGESINVQDLETNLYWEFRKFTFQDGESLESYYSTFYKMMNELIRNQCKVTNHQVNVQFLLQLQPEWQRFVTLVKQSQELKTVSYHKLYDILKQHQHEVNDIRAEKIARVANPLALVAQQQPFYHPQTHPTHYTQNSSTRS